MKRKNQSMVDFIILGAPIAIGAAFILPFVAFDVIRELINEKRKEAP